jgi:hypothetical protein
LENCFAFHYIFAEVARQKEKRIAEEKEEIAYEKSLNDSWSRYQAREKTLLEKVFNYSSTATEEGAQYDFWVSGDQGEHKCVLQAKSTNIEWVKLYQQTTYNNYWGFSKVDLRQINQNGFRIKNEHPHYGTFRNIWVYGDEKIAIIRTNKGQVMERLRKAWGLAFQECPGKKSDF